MKKGIVFLTILILMVWGCAENNPLTDPAHETNSSVTPSVTAEPNGEGLSGIADQTLSKKHGKKSSLTVDCLIKSKKSSELIMNTSYNLDSGAKGPGKHGKKVEVYAKIKFPAGAVDEDVTITMTFDPENEVFTFAPPMLFNKDAKLEVKLKGLDLKGVKKGDVDFVYLTVDGTEVYVKHSHIVIDKKKGELKVANLKLSHFSRYGFVH